MDPPPAPHPGARPAAFRFPFDESRAAIDAADRLIDELGVCRRRHRDAVAALGRSFEGASRAAFERWMAEVCARIDAIRAQLDADVEQLRAQLALARTREQASDRAIADWERRMAAHRADALRHTPAP